MPRSPVDNIMQLRFKLLKLWYALGALMLMAVAYVSLMPAPDIGVSDKVSHLVTYFLLAGWFGLLARNSGMLVLSLVGLIAYGMIIEVLQAQTGYRFAEWGDVLANSAGCLLGATLYFTPLRRLFFFTDARLALILQR